jgi:uridylate kinase
MSKKRILLKLTGEIFIEGARASLTAERALAIITQLKELHATHDFGIVIGGGNFFRGSQHGKMLGLRPAISHQIGMLGTMMNGLMFKELCEQQEIAADIFCAMPSPEVGQPIAHQTIMEGIAQRKLLIFTGGTGNPFFTTDTTAILRALQMGAQEVWKGTMVDGIYTADPAKDPAAQKLSRVTYAMAITQKLGIMDLTAYAMAERYTIPVRIFNIFAPNALQHVAHDPQFGSILC